MQEPPAPDPLSRVFRALAALLRLARDRSGSAYVEYALLTGLVALPMAISYQDFNWTLSSVAGERVKELSASGAVSPSYGSQRLHHELEAGQSPGSGAPPRAGSGSPEQGRPPPTSVGVAPPAGDCPGGVCQRPGQCFAAGTLVFTEHGDRPIDTLQVGERVWSRDDRTGVVELRPILQTFVTPHMPLFDLTVLQGGRVEHLRVTPGHPFWVEGEGWVDSDELSDGAALWSATGVATSAFVTSSEQTAEVHNLEVAGFHTYFVGALRAWVHNATICPPSPPGDCAQAQYDALSGEVHASKQAVGALGGCRPADDAYTLRNKLAAWNRQGNARKAINQTCFRGGDAGHKQALRAAFAGANKCSSLLQSLQEPDSPRNRPPTGNRKKPKR